MPAWKNLLRLARACALALAAVCVVAAQGPRPLERDLLATGPLFAEPRPGPAAPPGPGPGTAAASFPPRELGERPRESAAPAPPAATGVASLRMRAFGAQQRFYTMLAARENSSVIVFSGDGTRMAQIPAPGFPVALSVLPPSKPASAPPQAAPAGTPPSAVTEPRAAAPRPAPPPMPPASPKDAKLIFPSDFDVDADGRVIIADRGADAVKIYDSAGALLSTIAVQAPVSVAALPDGEIAVTNLRSEKLVMVYGLRVHPVGGTSFWRITREFGDPAEITADTAARELNRYVNIGRLACDAQGNLYYTFFYLPEPTIRKYDRWGFLITEFALTTPEFQPSAQSLRRAIDRLSQQRFSFGASGAPILRPSVTALGVDPISQDLWVAMGTQLLHFDKEGSRRGTYRTYTPDSQRVETTSILVEADRLIISSDSLGAFAFPRPDKQPPSAK